MSTERLLLELLLECVIILEKALSEADQKHRRHLIRLRVRAQNRKKDRRRARPSPGWFIHLAHESLLTSTKSERTQEE